MKFLHCADLHLDSPLRGLASYEGAPVDEIRGATRRAFENLVELAVRESVSCVVVAGDLYDGDRDDFNTAMFLQRHFSRLRDEGIPVAVVYGNHDAANEITKRLRPPPNVTVFPDDHPSTVVLPDGGMALHGQSYASRVVNEDLSAGYPARVPGLLNVGILHTALAGHEGTHARYAPCTEIGLADHGYGYWALGHVHERYETVREGSWICYPGNLQGRHARELGPKGATLVTYDGGEVSSVEHRSLDTVRWARIEIDASGVRDVDDLVSRAADALHRAVDEEGRLLAARLVITGETAALDRLLSSRELWEAQLRADAAGATGRIWIERIELGLSHPGARGEGSGEAIDSLRAAIRAARGEQAIREQLALSLSDLRSKLGGDAAALAEVGLVDLGERGVGELLAEIEEMVLAALQGTER